VIPQKIPSGARHLACNGTASAEKLLKYAQILSNPTNLWSFALAKGVSWFITVGAAAGMQAPVL